jgi:hypothetical protein
MLRLRSHLISRVEPDTALREFGEKPHLLERACGKVKPCGGNLLAQVFKVAFLSRKDVRLQVVGELRDTRSSATAERHGDCSTASPRF